MRETPEQRAEREFAAAMTHKYQIVIVCRDGTCRYRGAEDAPGDNTMIKWGVNLKAAFVTRYYPIKKGWLVIDVRRAQHVMTPGGSFGKWVYAPRSKTPIPTMEAAIMRCVHLITAQPAML